MPYEDSDTDYGGSWVGCMFALTIVAVWCAFLGLVVKFCLWAWHGVL